MDKENEVPRGWIVPSDNSPPFELPTHQVADMTIRWKPGEKKLEPGGSIAYHASSDHYERHPFEDEPNVFMYVRVGVDPGTVSQAVKDEIRRQIQDD